MLWLHAELSRPPSGPTVPFSEPSPYPDTDANASDRTAPWWRHPDCLLRVAVTTEPVGSDAGARERRHRRTTHPTERSMTDDDPTDELDGPVEPATESVRHTHGVEPPDTEASGDDADSADHTELTERLEAARREIDSLEEEVDSLERELEAERERRAAVETELEEKREEVDRYLEAKERRVREEKRRATVSLVESLLTRVWTPLGRGLAGDSEQDLRAGVELTREEFRSVLAAEGVEIIDPDTGTTLDRDVHEVLRAVERPDCQSNTVLQVERPGFRLDGEVVKKAEVFVAD